MPVHCQWKATQAAGGFKFSLSRDHADVGAEETHKIKFTKRFLEESGTGKIGRNPFVLLSTVTVFTGTAAGYSRRGVK